MFDEMEKIYLISKVKQMFVIRLVARRVAASFAWRNDCARGAMDAARAASAGTKKRNWVSVTMRPRL